jgi:Xaa-Pro dipeptidase
MAWKIKKRLAFPIEEYTKRLDALRHRMQAGGFDTLLVSSPENICYLSGFHTPGYYFPQTLIVTQNLDPLIVIRSLESKSIEAHSWLSVDQCRPFQDNEEPMAVIARAIEELHAKTGRLGVDLRSWYLTVDGFRRLEAKLPNATIVDGFGLVERGRSVKSVSEIEYIRRGCVIAGRGMRVAVNGCKRPETTEAELAADIHWEIVALGSEYPGLPLFLSSGNRTLIPHATWSQKRIERGDNVLVELAGVAERYAGPLFRTMFIGKPNTDLQDHAQVVEDMLAAVIDTLRAGATSDQVNQAALRAAGSFGVGVKKRAGYSVGLNFPPDWGEGFFLDLKVGDRTILEPGMVFHVPQTIRMPGALPVSISETVLVTDQGNEVLTNFPRKLMVVD